MGARAAAATQTLALPGSSGLVAGWPPQPTKNSSRGCLLLYRSWAVCLLAVGSPPTAKGKAGGGQALPTGAARKPPPRPGWCWGCCQEDTFPSCLAGWEYPARARAPWPSPKLLWPCPAVLSPAAPGREPGPIWCQNSRAGCGQGQVSAVLLNVMK